MCGTCGCGDEAAVHVEGDGEHVHVQADGTVVRHRHDPIADDQHEHLLPDGRVVRHSHPGGREPHLAHGVFTGHEHPAEHHHGLSDSEVRRIAVEQDVMARNDRAADLNRTRFAVEGCFVLNLMSGPGAGKTTLLVRTLDALKGRGKKLAVIEGDQQTSLDADRIRATGVPAVQVNTGKGCHLDAEMVMRALAKLPPPTGGQLYIENVGNLVCPAGFDLGEAKRAVVVSVTEGEDKPLKYPDMFAKADVVLVNKVDLVQALGFDLATLKANVRRVNPKAEVLDVSARTGEGFDRWIAWLDAAATQLASPAAAARVEATAG
ncbi:MAG: hydrogenase nickel incorporation protein HypB [Myxococcaceae bacterium]|nr:hydrogenase nickel incorporation protein HypB [Myxococcaceae bacterium]